MNTSSSEINKLEQLLARAFEVCKAGRRTKKFRQQQFDFVFHMTDWLFDLEELYDMVHNPENWNPDKAGEFLIGFLYHVIPHLNTAGKLLVGEISDPFETSTK